MARLHKGSKTCGDMQSELLRMPDTCTDIADVVYVELAPVNSVSDSSTLPIEYYYKGTPEFYPDLSQSELYFEVKATRKDGTALEKGEAVGPVNLLHHAMISQIDLYLNDELVTKNSGLYPWRAYMESTLSYGQNAKLSWLESSMFYADQHGDAFDMTDPAGSKINTGFISRAKYIAESQTADMLFRPHLDMFMQPRPILENVDIRLRLTRTPAEFCLMASSGNEYKLTIVNALFILRTVKLNTAVAIHHREALKHNGKALYPHRRVEMQSFTIPAGVLSHTRGNVVTGRLPRRIIFALTTNQAFNGVYTRSYCRFQPHGVNKINLLVNGRSLPTSGYTPQFSSTDPTGVRCTRCFNALASVCKLTHTDAGNSITRRAYEDGYTMFAFMLFEDWTDTTFGLVHEGNVQLEMRFATSTAEVLNGIMWCEYENTTSIDKHGVVMQDVYV
jgi:hypothetical protein